MFTHRHILFFLRKKTTKITVRTAELRPRPCAIHCSRSPTIHQGLRIAKIYEYLMLIIIGTKKKKSKKMRTRVPQMTRWGLPQNTETYTCTYMLPPYITYMCMLASVVCVALSLLIYFPVSPPIEQTSQCGSSSFLCESKPQSFC